MVTERVYFDGVSLGTGSTSNLGGGTVVAGRPLSCRKGGMREGDSPSYKKHNS